MLNRNSAHEECNSIRFMHPTPIVMCPLMKRFLI